LAGWLRRGAGLYGSGGWVSRPMGILGRLNHFST
jgi:hypothetical protein